MASIFVDVSTAQRLSSNGTTRAAGVGRIADVEGAIAMLEVVFMAPFVEMFAFILRFIGLLGQLRLVLRLCPSRPQLAQVALIIVAEVVMWLKNCVLVIE